MTTAVKRRRGTPRRHPARGDPAGGAVTAEIATALPALVVVVIGALWVVSVGLAQLRCADAAREAARAAARGDEPAVVSSLARAVAPDGAAVRVHVKGDVVTVEVTARVPPPLPFGDQLVSPTVRASAAAITEAS
ncbi:MAG TPA: TadE family type IV pilus minor pilin [Jiangellaceae bacterium]|nr:TadE family type IV pilus minor pilin [Jiangellaceae bacterium]